MSNNNFYDPEFEEYKREMDALMARWKELSKLKSNIMFLAASNKVEEEEKEKALIGIDKEIEQIRVQVFMIQDAQEKKAKNEAAAFVVGLLMILCIIGFFVLLIYVAVT